MESSQKPPFPTDKTGLLFSWKNTRQPRTNARLPLFTHSAFLWCFCVVVVWISLPYRAKTVGLMHNSIRKRDKRVTLSILTTSSQLYGAMVTLWLTMTTPHRFFQPDMASNIAGWWGRRNEFETAHPKMCHIVIIVSGTTAPKTVDSLPFCCLELKEIWCLRLR